MAHIIGTDSNVEHARFEGAFERVVAAVILFNAAVAVWGLADHGHEDLAERAETVCLVFFCVELAVRLGRLARTLHLTRHVGGHVAGLRLLRLGVVPVAGAARGGSLT